MIPVLLSLFAFACLSSMSAMDAFAALLTMAVVWKAWNWKKNSEPYRLFNTTGFDFVFVVWLAVVSIGLLMSASDATSLWGRFFEFKWIFIWYAVTAAIIFVKPKENVIKWCCLALSLACIVAITIAVIGYDVKGAKVNSLDGSLFSRTGGLYGNSMVMAHCYGVFFCFLAGCLIYFKGFQKKDRAFLALTILLCGVALLLTFTRGVWISLFFALVAMSFWHRKKLAAMVVVAGLAVFGLAFTFWEAFRDRTLYAFDPQSFDQIRWNLWRANIEIFKDHPWFGAGYGQNTKLLPIYFERLGITEMMMQSHAHNQALHMLAGTGVFGFVVFVLFNFFFLRLSLRVLKSVKNGSAWHKGLALGAFGAQIHFLAGGLFESNMEHAKMKYVMMFAWGTVVWLAYEYKVLTWSRKKLSESK